MAPHARAAESRIFYGWWVAAAFSIIIFLSTGICFVLGPFLKPVVGDLGIDRGTFSLVIFAMASALTADIFGRFSVGSIFGLVFFMHQVGVALGSRLSGVLFDVSGGYGFAFAIACGLLLVGAGLSLSIDVNGRPVRRELQPVAGGR
jgi:MFS family permease